MFQIAEMNVSIKKLSIENFKCFKKEQSFDFTKLTILTGANSSGKSSILSAVLGALQSVGFPFKFSTNGKHINMGDFKEISNSHNIENKIKINFTLYSILDNYSYNIFSTWEDDSISHLPILKEVVLKSECVQLKVYKKSSGYFLDFSYDPENDPETKNDDKKLVHEESLAAAEVSFSRVNMNFKSDWTKEKAIEDYKKYLDSYFEKKTITNFKIRMIDEVVLSVRDKKNKRLDDTV
ncbi:MAG TPA: AAA family ATPase, partial [Puia sp.]|nr:AAA family ATPase [Puia sp.]